MKTKLLIIIGIVIASTISLSSYAIYVTPNDTFIECFLPYEQVNGQCIKPTFKILLNDPITLTEPLIVSIEKIGYYMCDEWNASIIDTANNSTVWEKYYPSLCVVAEPPQKQKFLYTVSNEKNPIIINETGKYLFQINIGEQFLEQEFTVRKNHSGISIGSSVYPIPIDSSLQECADLFDRILQEHKDKPCACCNHEPGEPVCEPVGFDSILANNKEFRDSGCEFTYRDWAPLTNDTESTNWLYPSYHQIDMFKTNFSKEIPIEVSYRGYDECISLKVVINEHGGQRTIVDERDYENICSINENKEYRLPLHKAKLTDYGEPIILPKGTYQLRLYNIMNGEIIDDESRHVGQVFFSSHYVEGAESKVNYDYTKSASDVLRETTCADWFDKIMYSANHNNNPEFDLKYELTETNVFRDLNCASIVSNWEPLTGNEVWDIGISWEEIIEHNEN